MPRLIWVFAGRTLILFVLSCRGSYIMLIRCNDESTRLLVQPQMKPCPQVMHATSNEPTHEIMALSVLRKLILQTRTRSHPVGLDVWFLVGLFVYFSTSSVRTAKALVRLRGCAGSPESSLVAFVISTIISWAGSNEHDQKRFSIIHKNISFKQTHLQCI